MANQSTSPETDPAPADRIWYRHGRTGDRGFLTQRDGKDVIKLDRPMEDAIRPFRGMEWVAEHEERPFTKHQVAQIAHAADQRLAFFMGSDTPRKEWISMTERERIEFMDHGPPEIGVRHRLFVAINKCLEELTRS